MTERRNDRPEPDLAEILRQVLAGLAPTHGFSALIDRLERQS